MSSRSQLPAFGSTRMSMEVGSAPGRSKWDEDGIASPIGVHRDGRCLVSHRTRELLGQLVDVSKRVKAHDHV
jgi:hypothetical protein